MILAPIDHYLHSNTIHAVRAWVKYMYKANWCEFRRDETGRIVCDAYRTEQASCLSDLHPIKTITVQQ